MNVPDFNEVWDEILSEKIIKKHRQYGDSLEDPALIFNGIMNNQLLIDVRLDDKLSRIRTLSNEDPKYWSEIREIVAYLMWKLVLNKQEIRDERNSSSSDRQPRDTMQSPISTGEGIDRFIRNIVIR